jgi:tetratricopeptide (TPR) repeat protein
MAGPVYSLLMKRRLTLLLALLALLVLPQMAQAQGSSNTRIVILPFNVPEGSESYIFGLAAALQRSLNTIDGWFVAPVGDAALLSGRVQSAGLDVATTLLELFDADVIVSGQARGGSNPAASVTLVGPAVLVPQFAVEADSDTPTSLVQAVADALLAAVGKELSGSERQEFDRMVEQTPSLPSLASIAVATAGLPGPRADDIAIAAQLDPSSSWVHSELARALLREGRIAEAREAAQDATELLTTDPDAWTILGVVLLAERDFEASVAAFNRALELNPSHALALAGRGNANTSSDDLESAIESYPRLTDAYLSLAAAETDVTRSLQILRRAGRYLPESVALHRSALARAISGGDPLGATSYLRAALSTPLGASPALYALAADLPASQATATRELIDEGVAAFPTDVGLQLVAARLDLEIGDIDAARQRLEPLNAGAPNDPEIANLLALVLARSGEIDSASLVLVAVSDDSLAAELNLAVLLLEAGRSQAALEILEPAHNADPTEPRLASYTAIALSRVGRVDEAEALLRDVLTARPNFELAERALSVVQQQAELVSGGSVAFDAEAGEAYERGMFALQSGNLIQAASAFAEARSFDDHPLLAFYHGYTLQLTGRAREAVPAYQRALEGFPDSDTVHNNAGYAFLQIGRLDLALPELRTAVALNGQNARAHLNLGLAQFEQGRYRDALDSWNRAVALSPLLEDEIANLRSEATRRLEQQ